MNSVEIKTRDNPPITSLQNLSLAFIDKYKHLIKIKKYKPINIVNPTKPNSSAITANIKSVSVSGRKLR